MYACMYSSMCTWHVQVVGEHEESVREVGRYAEENMALRQQAAALRNQLVDSDEALAAKDQNILELVHIHTCMHA